MKTNLSKHAEKFDLTFSGRFTSCNQKPIGNTEEIWRVHGVSSVQCFETAVTNEDFHIATV